MCVCVCVRASARPRMIIIQGRELNFGDFEENIFKIGCSWMLID